MDFAKPENKKVADLLEMRLLMFDEVSMIDTDCWHRIVELLSMAQQTRRPGSNPRDEFGDIHVILFGAGFASLK
jgi:hypothetical protein